MDKSYTPKEFLKLAEAWYQEKDKRSIIVVAMEQVGEKQVEVQCCTSGNKKDLVIGLAEFINENPEIARLATKLAEVMREHEEKEKNKK